jgi:hypothetical protein
MDNNNGLNNNVPFPAMNMSVSGALVKDGNDLGQVSL